MKKEFKIGDLCLYNEITVILLKEFHIKNEEDDYPSWLCLFPKGKDTVSEKSLVRYQF